MIRKIGFVVLAVLAYGIFLIATFPAERAFALVAGQAPNLRAAGLTGTAWSGQAAVIQVQGQNLERLRWQLKPWSVLLGQLELDLQLDGADLAGSATVGLKPDGSVQLSDVDLRLAGSQASTLFRAPMDLGGQFVLQLQSASLLGQKLQSADGVVRWQRAAVVSPFDQPLGEFVANLSSEAEGVKAQVKDEGGPLQLDGVATLKPDGSYSFNGSVTVRDTQQQLLVQGVKALGRPGPDGRVPLRYNGRI